MSQASPLHLFASAISLEISAVFVAQFLLFGLFIVLLKPLLFDPLIKVFEERERRTEGAKAEARTEAAQILESGKARIAAEVAQLRKELDGQKPELAGQIAARILGREVAR